MTIIFLYFDLLTIQGSTVQHYRLLEDPGKARGCSINSLVINSLILINSVSQPFPPTALRRRHARTVRDSTSMIKKIQSKF